VLVVHALWSLGRGLLLWAEDGDRPARAASQATRSARPHPFALPAEALAGIHPGKPGMATLLLPSTRSAPLDSPELTRAVPRRASRARTELLAWSVPVVAVDAAELADPVDELRYGASAAHLRALAEFAGELAARGRTVPALELDEAGGGLAARAVWRPLLTGPDAVVRDALVDALPPVGRCEQQGPHGMAVLTGDRGQDPGELVDDALTRLVDQAVRERLGRDGTAVTLVPPRRGRRPGRVPALEVWLDALSRGDGRFDGRVDTDPGELHTLHRALRPWARTGQAPVRRAGLVLRLSELRLEADPTDPDPGLGDSAWRVEFLLRSARDPSLLLSAEQIWSAPETAGRWIDGPAEVLLAELARAGVLYPELAGALRGSHPAELELDVEGAYRFLAEVATRLAQAGVEVLLPSWWSSSERPRLGLAVSASSAPVDGVITSGSLGKEQLAGFSWRLAVGDAVLTEEEITELVATKAPLVRLRGTWVAVDPERLRRGLEFLRSAPAGPADPAEVLAVMTAVGEEPGGALPLPVVSAEADGWLGELLSGTAERTLTPADPPPGFRATLRPYQRRGLSWLRFLAELGLGACLADDMGLGKTVQLLALEAGDRQDGERRAPTLLLCPMSLVGNWQREAARFAPDLRVHAHHGPARAHGAELTAELADADLVVTTYTTMTRDIEELSAVDWHRVVLDEAQLVKNARSGAARAARTLRARHRIALTGTPMENRLSELWSVMDFLNPGVLGSADRFRHRYAVPVERYGDTEAAGRLRRITRPYLLRRVKTDREIIDDLPEKIEIVQDYRLTTEQATLYRTVVDDMLEKIDGADAIRRRGTVLAAMSKLKQVCNHPAQLLHDGSPIGRRSGKVLRLEEVLAEILAEGDRTLLFTQFTEFAEMLVPHLSARFDTEVLYLHGGTPKARRDRMVARFQSGEGPSVFLLSLKAGGTGLNLTAANHVLHLDRWWNPAVENQATDRAFRIGQKRTVQVRKFVCAGTLEERIDAMIESKKELTDLVISDGEGWLTELSTAHLRELFALGDEAVGE
jgi:superfamily II DNA or RNA helicase